MAERPYRRLLLALDVASSHEALLGHTVIAATTLGAEVTIVHALEALPRETARQQLATAAAHLTRRQVRVRGILCEPGPPAATVLDLLQRRPCDVLVLGTHRCQTPESHQLGEAAQALVSGCRLPVLLCPMQPTHFEPCVTCGVDWHDDTEDLFHRARVLARLLGLRLDTFSSGPAPSPPPAVPAEQLANEYWYG